MAEETTTTPPAEGVTLKELKDAITAGVTTGVAEALKANAPAPPPPADPPAAEPQEDVVAKAVDEAKANLEVEWQVKLDRAVAEMRAVHISPTHTDPDVLKASDLVQPEKPFTLKGVPGIAADMLYMEMVAKGYADTKRCSLRENRAVMKALDTATDGSGADYIPEGFSDQFIADVQAALMLPKAFRSIPMATEKLTLPVTPTTPTAYLVGENTTRATEITPSSPGTRNMQLSAVKLAVRMIESFEYEQAAWPIALQLIRESIVQGVAEGIEDAILNGDTAASHMDADVTSSGDRRKAFIGLRAKAVTDIASGIDIATFNADTLNSIPKTMGKYGVDFRKLIWVVGTSGWNQLRMLRDAKDNPAVLTVDKYGPGATILSGEVGKLLGSPVVYSQFMREDLNASGVYDGTTQTKTAILCVWAPAWVLGDRQSVTLETQRFISSQNSDVVAVWRGDFQHALSTAHTTVMGYNLTS